jgi:molecular chaperone GrpE
LSEEAKPVRKIKPPSASFLKSKEVPPPSGEESALLVAPSMEDDADLFVVPEVEPPVPPPEKPETAAAAPEPEPSSVSEVAPTGTAATTECDRLKAELRELQDIVNSSESLAYLRTRIARALEEGSDALTLVSFYRLVVRSLAEQSEQVKREQDLLRSRANKLELELATAVAGGVVSAAIGEGAVPPSKGISEEASARIAQLETEVAQANEQREKLLFDFKNMRERTQKDLDIRMFREKEKFFKGFLPVLDAFERAQQSFNENTTASALVEGYRMIETMMFETLTAEGLEPIDTSGEFDPRFHEAVGEVENDQKPQDHIFDELSRGYRLGERLVRPAMVRLSRNPNGHLRPPSPPVGDSPT